MSIKIVFLINLILLSIWFFFRKSTEKTIITIFLVFLTLCFNNWVFWNFSELNNYSNVFFWKTTAVLNNLKLNICALFFLVFFLKNQINQAHTNNKNFALFLYFFLVFYYTSTDHITTSVGFVFVFKKLNLALLNGVLNIHPWLIFILYALLLLLFIFIFNRFSNNKINYWNFTWWLVKLKAPIINISIISIVLGSYWAFQELSWGGWWNWDIVELISLNFFFFSLLLGHSNSDISYTTKKNYFYLKLSIIFLITIIIVRFNLISSIHAFVNPQLIKLSFYKLSFVIIFYTLSMRHFYMLFKKTHFVCRNINKTRVIYFNYSLTLLYIYIYSYLTYILILESDRIDLNYVVEISFVLIYLYFFFSFFKVKNTTYTLVLYTHPINYLFALLINYITFVINSLGVKNKSTKKQYLIKVHFLALVGLFILYFLKIYSAAFAVMGELHYTFGFKNLTCVSYSNNFILDSSVNCVNTNFFLKI